MIICGKPILEIGHVTFVCDREKGHEEGKCATTLHEGADVGLPSYDKPLTFDEIKSEVKRIESDVCRLSMRLLDQSPALGTELIKVGKHLLNIYKSVQIVEASAPPPTPENENDHGNASQ